MRNRFRIWISTIFYYSGVIKLIRWWSHRFDRHLIILYYHYATGENLRSQWLYLRRHYRILHLEAALKELYTPIRGKVYKQDRRPLLALTFDDGYYDNYTHAFALASDLQIPMTIFLVPGYVEKANTFWWLDRLIYLAQVDQVPFEGRTYHLYQQEERKALAQIVDDRVRNAASVVDRERFLISICALLAVPSSAIPKEDPAPLLTWAQIREMEESGCVSFGAHTVHHSDLQRLINPVEVQSEVEGCRTILEQQLGHKVDIFAYPYGHIGEYGFNAVKQAGYKWAATTLSGRNTLQSNPYLLHRRNADANKHVLVLAAEVVGVWDFFTYLKKIARLLVRSLHRTSTILTHSEADELSKKG
jgi:peptidoglycan/xylan/chitin deacetylase (PgdA/CDA1 family)